MVMYVSAWLLLFFLSLVVVLCRVIRVKGVETRQHYCR